LPVPAPPSAARERILGVATALFYKEGYRAIGVDRVIAEADVAKATFYKHFPAKDDLIAAVIEAAGAKAALWQEGLVAGRAEPLFALVEGLMSVATAPHCVGCMFQGSASEFPDIGHPGHKAALEVKRWTLRFLADQAKAQGVPQPESTAEAVFLLIEGVWASVRMFGPGAPVRHVPALVRRLCAAPQA